MFHPVYLIFRVRSRWGKPSEEFLILLIQICLWFRETNTQSWGRGGINSPDTCILQQKPQLLLFKQTWPGNARRSKCYLQPGREQRICLQVAEVIRKPGQIVGDVVACLKMGHFPSWPFLDGALVS